MTGMQHNIVPCEKLWDRPTSFAFLNHKPEAKGHALLVIKAAAATLSGELLCAGCGAYGSGAECLLKLLCLVSCCVLAVAHAVVVQSA